MRVGFGAVVLGLVALGPVQAQPVGTSFDHRYEAYARVLQRHVRMPRVDYASLEADRGPLDRVVASFDAAAAHGEAGWTRHERMAFWINAYNALTLHAIIDHYPIRAGWFARSPRNSIRQIDGVWTRLTWKVAGRPVTLDDIEHRILRPTFGDARVHFALNCASISCPVLAADPYLPETLDRRLDEAGQAYLASREGLQTRDGTLWLSSIFKWYGDDFVDGYASLVPGARHATERAILGVIVRHGTPDAAAVARQGTARIAFLDYDWSLNDVARP